MTDAPIQPKTWMAQTGNSREVIPQVGLLDTPHLHRTPMGFMFLPLGTFNLQVLWRETQRNAGTWNSDGKG